MRGYRHVPSVIFQKPYIMKRYIISALAALATATAGMAGTVDFGYSPKDASETWGTNRAETYAIAIRVPGKGLEGKKVTSISVPVAKGTTLTDCSVFLASELKGNSGKPQTDYKYDFTPAEGTVTVTLPEAYEIKGDFYAGYIFKVASVTEDADKQPVVCADGYVDGGFYISTSRTYRKWASPVSLDIRSALRVSIEGDFKNNECAIVSLANAVSIPGEATKGKAVISNCGLQPISSVSYTYEVNGKSTSGTASFDPAIAADLVSQGSVSFDIPAMDKIDIYEGTFTITKVNGTDCSVSAVNRLSIMERLPVKRALMEEYTGTWCGWCPRGMVAMKLLSEEWPDRFVGVAYHSGDVMQTVESFPANVAGFPDAVLNRTIECDPYFGTSSGTEMYIRTDIAGLLEQPVDANIDVTAQFNYDGSKIEAKAEVYYFNDYPENPYLLSFLVTENGVTGSDPKVWGQHSYYAGATDDWGPEMDAWTHGTALELCSFDDVLLGSTRYRGIEGSQPTSVKTGETAEGSAEFDCSTFVSLDNGENLLQNYDKVSVVALLVNKNTGAVANCAKVNLSAPASVADLSAERGEVVSKEYHDISGRRLGEKPAKGLYLETVKYSDGTARTFKHIR